MVMAGPLVRWKKTGCSEMVRREKKPDKRGAPKGRLGNVPHIHNEQVAVQVEILAGYGLARWQIADFIDATFDDQGYSESTIKNHYAKEFKLGKAKTLSMLMQGAYDKALQRNVPKGVTPDTVYREALSSTKWLLSAVHKISSTTNLTHANPDGSNLNFSTMTDDELDEFIAERLPGGAK